MRQTTVRTLSIIVATVGIAVIIGWVFGIDGLKSVHPALVTMKFTTALSFVLSGAVMYGLGSERSDDGGAVETVLPLLGFTLILIMGTMLVSGFSGVRTGIEDLVIEESVGAVASVTPGRPSVGTMLAFIFVAVAALFAPRRDSLRQDVCRAMGWAIAFMGAVAFLGYVMSAPPLYFHVEGVSTGMALHTSLTFILVGVGIVVASMNTHVEEPHFDVDRDAL